MNTIPLPQLVELLALATNSSEETARVFLTSLWDVIGQALADGRQARIKGIGTFALGGLNGDQLQFIPDEGLAEAVNSSFSFFEPMVLEDGIDESMLAEEEEAVAEEVETPKEAVTSQEDGTYTDSVAEDSVEDDGPSKAGAPEADADEGETSLRPSKAGPPRADADEDATSLRPSKAGPPRADADEGETSLRPSKAGAPDADADEDATSLRPSKAGPPRADANEDETHRRLNPWMMLGIGLVAGFALGFFIPWRGGSAASLEEGDVAPVDSIEVVEEEVGDTTWVSETDVMEDSLGSVESIENIESIGQAAVAEKPTVVYDTIGPRRFLTTMARKYYGRYEFWPYIYQENQDKLGHPDRIAPGTVVVIPPAEKYGINPDDPESLKAASRLNAEIYARF